MRISLIVTAILAAAALVASGTGARAECPDYPPVINFSGTTFYRDAKGSQTDKQAEEENKAKQAPVTDFINYDLFSLDGAPSWSKLTGLSAACANTLLENWARAGALRTTLNPDGSFSRQGGIDRQLLLRSLVFVALKLKARGMALGPDVSPWLDHLVENNNRDWQKNSLRTNLYYWAGATAAADVLLSNDASSMAFQQQVWTTAMSAIHDDGTLDAELARGARALVYHQYALSALLTLREARRALGLPVSAAEEERLKRLADRIGASLCHPETMAARAGVASVEIPGEWGFREIAAYGGDLAGPDLRKCGVPVKNYYDVNNGGDQLKSLAMFHALARHS